MSETLYCPLKGYEDSYIKIPGEDEWKGRHAQRKDEAITKALEAKLGTTLTSFAVALALLDDWRIPELNGNPAEWDFDDIDLSLITWISEEVLARYQKKTRVPKALSSPLSDGSTASEEE